MMQGGMTSLWKAAIFVPLANKHIFMTVLQYAKNPHKFTVGESITNLNPNNQVDAAVEPYFAI